MPPKDWKSHNLKLQRFEKRICPKKYKFVAGVDEAGRGPLAGPVVACAVILRQSLFTAKIFDSKKLSAAARRRAFIELIRKADIGVGIADRELIDQKNILQATILAIKKAVADLRVRPQFLLVDGKFKRPFLSYPYRNVVGGDRLCLSIACASIAAKVFRDNLMSYYATVYPQYGFNRNRGYLTKEHLRAIKKYGITPIHRRSFRPIKSLGGE